MPSEKSGHIPEEGPRSPSATILIADDFDPWRLRIRDLLADRPEWQIICEACDGLEALEKTRELHPDVVLLDVGMPGLNGFEAAKAIRESSPNSRIIFLSHLSESELRSAAAATGAEGYVLKSKVASELVTAIAQALSAKVQ